MNRIIRAAIAAATALGVVTVAPAAIVTAVAPDDGVVFISELHYDNDGADQGEAVEIFGPADTDLTGWSVVFYNGSATQLNVYATAPVFGSIPDQSGGFGVVPVAQVGIQNGSPDGLALVDSGGDVRQFLSYEGSFTAADGPAAGLTSTDILVSETGTTPFGFSLQLTGEGSCYGDFAWNPPATASFGAINAGMTPVAGECDGGGGGGDLPPVRLNELHYDNGGADENEAVEVIGPVGTDLTGWTIAFYNGSATQRNVYATATLAGVIADQGGGVGVVAVAQAGIQNGSPDGLALVDAGGAVIEFLSYEGVFEAADGPAAGSTSTDIGVSEGASTGADQSLQRDDQGNWAGPLCASFGELNDPEATAECVIDPPDPVVVTIHDVQGAGDTSPFDGQRVIVEGIVVGDHEGSPPALGGFMLQEQDADADADPNTSEGIFVFNRFDTPNDVVSLGDVVTVEGTVAEFTRSGQPGSLTQLSNAIITVDATGAPLPAATVVTFPRPLGLSPLDGLEPFESMLVTLPEELVISEYFNYDRFGEIVVAKPLDGEDRPYSPTAVHDEDSQAAQDRLDLNLRSRITIDDGITSSNPDAPIHPITRDLFSLTNAFRGGDTVSGLTGPTHFDFGLARLLPYAPGEAPLPGFATYEQTTAPAAPEAVGGSLQIATLNALNYFLTLDDGVNDVCGPNQNFECRGADDAEEFERQRVKLLKALEGLDADVVGLVEIENRPGVEALADVVAGLNDLLGAGTYDYVAAGVDSVVGTDAIKVGIIYRPASVTPLGDPAILDTPEFLDPNNTGTPKNRAAVAQTFVENGSGEVFSVAVNHLKSKGSGCGAGDDHPLAGSCNVTRTLAAGILADWIADGPTGVADDDWMILGDLNSYDHEDPISALTDAGYTDLIRSFQGEFAYSFVFDGQYGYLDYAMSSSSLTSQVTGATEWHINSDEPDVFDYDTSFKSAYQDTLFDPATPFRASDHDAALVGLSLGAVDVAVTATPGELWPPNHKLRNIQLTATAGGGPAGVVAVSATSSEADSGLGADDVPGDIVITDGALQLRAERFARIGRTYTVVVMVSGAGQVVFDTVNVVVPHDRRSGTPNRPN